MESCELIMISGWIEKKSRYLKAWRRRWVCFNGLDILTFAKKQNIGGYHKDSKQIYYSIPVQVKATEIINVMNVQNNYFKVNNYTNVFSLTLLEGKSEREICFRCSSQKIFVGWVKTIKDTINMAQSNKYMISKVISLDSYYYYNVKKYIETNNIALEQVELVISFQIRHNIDLNVSYFPCSLILLCARYYGENKERIISQKQSIDNKNKDELDRYYYHRKEDKYLVSLNILNSLISVWYDDNMYIFAKMIVILSILLHSGWLNIVLPVNLEFILLYINFYVHFIRVTFGDLSDI